MPTQTNSTAPPDRRQRFRMFMRRFNPLASAKTSIEDGLVCQFEGRSLFKKLAAGADLAQGSQQLLVGGIGSGKTTELRLAERELARHDNTLPLYIDVSAETDLSTVNAGALLASLGMHAWGAIISNFGMQFELAPVSDKIRLEAYGYKSGGWVAEDEEPDFDLDWIDQEERKGYYRHIKIPGKLSPPFPALQRDVKDLTELVSNLTSFLRDQGKELVVFFDGLDRLINADQFWAVAEQDFRAIKQLDISVLAAGPLSIMYGKGRQIKDYFDEVHSIRPAIAGPGAEPFLFEILSLRGAEELMHPNQMRKICSASGGVLRDLISLARRAGENAYLADADEIDESHVDRAIEQLGDSYLLGLGTKQKQVLNRILAGQGFNPSEADNMELLVSRRVIEQSGSEYQVHPALAALLVFGIT